MWKFSDINIKSMLRNVREIPDQDIPIRIPSVPTASRLKQNYVEFQQSYMGILDEVKHEAEQARSLDSDIEKIKNEAYDEFAVVMAEIYDAGVSMPEVTWNEDGSLDIGCTDYGFLGHSLKEDCAIMTILIERSIQWPNAEDSPLSLKQNLFSKSSAVAVLKQKCVEDTISTKINSHSDEKRIAHLEQLVGRMAVALDIQKKLLTELDLL